MRAALVLAFVILPVFAEPAPEAATRFFDVGALLEAPPEPAVPALDLGGGVLEFLDANGDSPEPPRFVDEEELVDLILRLVDPESWNEEMNSLDLSGRWLRATAGTETLDLIGGFLEALWAEASRRVEVEAEWVLLTAAAVERLSKAGALTGLRGGRVDGGVRRVVLDEAGKEGSRLFSGTVVTASGRLATLRQTTSTSYVADIAVEIAQGSRVGDPIVRFVPEGWFLAVRPTILLDGSVLVETIHQTAALEGPIRRIAVEAEPLGTLDLPALGLERFSASAHARPGETLVTIREGGRGPHPVSLLLLTPRVTGGPAVPGPVTHLPARALLSGRTALRAVFPDTEGEVDEDGPYPSDLFLSPRIAPRCGAPLFSGMEHLAEHLSGRLRAEDPPAASPAGLFLAAGDPRAAPARNLLAALETRTIRGFRAHLVFEDGPEGGEARPSSAIHLSLPAGAETLFEAGTERAFLADQDVEVAQEARVCDPVVRHAFGGFVATFRVDPAPAGDAFSGRVKIVVTDLDPTFEVRRAGIAEVGVIEIPRSRQVVVDREFAGRSGAPIVLDAGRRPDGTRLLLTLTVDAE